PFGLLQALTRLYNDRSVESGRGQERRQIIRHEVPLDRRMLIGHPVMRARIVIPIMLMGIDTHPLPASLLLIHFPLLIMHESPLAGLSSIDEDVTFFAIQVTMPKSLPLGGDRLTLPDMHDTQQGKSLPLSLVHTPVIRLCQIVNEPPAAIHGSTSRGTGCYRTG